MEIKYAQVIYEKPLPGGGPQGTLLGLLLFIVLINNCGFQEINRITGDEMSKPKRNFMPRTLHTKFVDDLFLAESLNLKDALAINPLRQLPDNYHSRFGMKLSPEKSQVYKELINTLNFANNNDMKLNLSKTKFILFNPTRNYDFEPHLNIDGSEIEIDNQTVRFTCQK